MSIEGNLKRLTKAIKDEDGEAALEYAFAIIEDVLLSLDDDDIHDGCETAASSMIEIAGKVEKKYGRKQK